MRLKDNVKISYCDIEKKTKINQGTIEYIIADENKYYYNVFTQEKIELNNTPKEQYDFLINNALICNDSSYDNIDERFKRNMYFFEAFSEKVGINPKKIHNRIQNKTILIIGFGGIGTIVVDNLQRMGFKNFILIDYDIVEPSNLNRQMFFNEQYYGEFKVDVAESELLNGCNIKKCYKNINSVSDLEKLNVNNVDFLINCADTPTNIVNIVNEFAKKYKIPTISGSVGTETGTWGPIYDTNNLYHPIDIENNDMSIKGSNASTNSIISSFIAFEVMLYITNLYEDYLFYKEKILNFKTLFMEVN